MATPTTDINTFVARIDAKYPFSSDRTHYGTMLRGVASKTVVHDIIKDIVTTIDGISKEPYGMSDGKKFLYGYMNECIAKNFEEAGKPKIECFSEAYINIREHENAKVTKDRIVQAATKMGLDVEQTKNKIDQTFDEFEKNFRKLSQYPYNSNGYNQYLPLCKEAAAVLLRFRYDPYGLPYGIRFGYNLFTEVKKEQEKKQLEKVREEREQRRKMDEKRQKEIQFKKEQRAMWIKIIIGIFGVVGFIAFLIWFSSVDTDGTVGNWIIALIVILALMKKG
jgi:hypothetical protein